MKKTILLGMSALATLAVAVPSEAQWVRLGKVHVEHNQNRDTTYSEFAGPVENLTFTARGSDMWCRDITVRYGNGERERVYSGKLTKDQAVDTDVRGQRQKIEHITMACSAENPRGGELNIGANIGRFRQAWDKTKFWAARFAHDTERRMGMSDRNEWITVGRENFQGRHDQETTRVDRSVDRIALRPVDGDARCMRVSATFGNGRTRDLDVDRHEVMERGRISELNLPGEMRGVRSVDLSCRAVDGRQVTIEILARN